jgi:hypothetical protein
MHYCCSVCAAGIVNVCVEALANSMQSQATIGNIAFDGLEESLAIQRVRIEKAMCVTFGCGNGQRHGINRLPKRLSYSNT